MIFAIDMGNTNIVIGCVDDKKTYFVERISTDKKKTALEYAVSFKTVFDLYGINPGDIDGAILSSVVPPLQSVIKEAVKMITGLEPIVVGPGVKTGLNIKMDNPKTVGADMIVDAVAAIEMFGAPLIVIDMGTATTLSVIDDKGSYVGGVIIPGVRLSMEALASSAGQLFRVSLDTPKKVIGKNTIDCIQNGLMVGNACGIDGLIDRIEEELGYTTTKVATGGLAKKIIPLCRKEITLVDDLLLRGLMIIYDRNVSKKG